MKRACKKLGKNQQKLLMLLLGGIALGLTRSPRYQYRIVRGMVEGWREIDGKGQTRVVAHKDDWITRVSAKCIRRTETSLYASKLLKRIEHKDGSVTLLLTCEGRKRALRYHLDTIVVKKQKEWDGKWRVVLYDIPEEMRDLRIELHQKLRSLGFVELQHSVFVHPYECTDEIEFLIEAYDARKYIRRMLVEEIDISEPLKKAFGLETKKKKGIRKDGKVV